MMLYKSAYVTWGPSDALKLLPLDAFWLLLALQSQFLSPGIVRHHVYSVYFE